MSDFHYFRCCSNLEQAKRNGISTCKTADTYPPANCITLNLYKPAFINENKWRWKTAEKYNGKMHLTASRLEGNFSWIPLKCWWVEKHAMKKDYRARGVGKKRRRNEISLQGGMWSLGDPVMSRALVRTGRSSPAEILLLLTNLHLDKAIKSLPKCN